MSQHLFATALSNGQSSQAVAPVAAAERISSVDVVRGVALLGILLMNITDFALPHWAYDNPTVAGGATGLNLKYWFINHVLFEGKMRALFSMLFGAGVILLTSRAESRGSADTIADIYYRRLLWLLLFGVLDAYVLLWPGDILYAYALCGLLLFPFRKLSARALIISGLLCLSVLAGKGYLRFHDMQTARNEATAAEKLEAAGKKLTDQQKKAKEKWAAMVKEMKPTAEEVKKSIKDVQSGYTGVFLAFIPVNTMIQSTFFYHGFWDMLGMMFIGMGLLKMGVFSGQRTMRFYALMALIGYGIGIPLGFYSGFRLMNVHFEFQKLTGFLPLYDIRRLTVALGHVGVVMMICKANLLPWLTSRLAAVGQMALSNYVMHTLICTMVFYGYGFGLFGKLQRVELLYVVGAIWLLQLMVSPIWLRYFRFGPLEWLWRSLTYWQPQPMRRSTTGKVVAA